MNDQEYHDHVIASLATITANQASMKETLDKSLDFLHEEDGRIERESELRYNDLADKHDKLKTRVNWMSGASSMLGLIVGWAVAFFRGS